MLRFFIWFVVLICALFGLEITNWGQEHLVLPFTTLVAKASGLIIQLFDRDVIAVGNKLLPTVAGKEGIEIVAGCNGVEAIIILAAAVFSFPATWRQKLAGFTVGFFAIQALNMVRIISLYYILQWSKIWFDWFHLYLWQALIILDALIVWLLWLRWISRTSQAAAAATAAAPNPAT
jgi:exosortase H (IPTLxxWG-CTERM-specific)